MKRKLPRICRCETNQLQSTYSSRLLTGFMESRIPYFPPVLDCKALVTDSLDEAEIPEISGCDIELIFQALES